MRVKNRASGYIRSTRSRFGQITLAIVVLPPFLKMAFSLSSMASGLALVMLTIVVWESVKATTLVDRRSLPQSGNRAIFCFATLQFILAHAIWTNIVTSEFDFSRFAPSFAYLALMLASALLLIQRVMRRTSDAEVGRAIHLCLKFLALNAIFGLTGLTFFESGSLKQTGLFSEPSHLALAVAPFLVYTCLTKEKYSNHFLLGFMLWGIVIQNLTMLVAVTLAFAASSELKLKVKYVAVAGLFLTPIFVIDVSYFADRLFISDENTNLSVLVLLQGWQNALLLMDQSGGGGGGFQHFGWIGEFGELTQRIIETGGSTLNLYDGGSTASKLVGEFGYLGFVLIAGYFYVFVRCLMVLRDDSIQQKFTAFDRFTMACVIGYVLEVAVRGVGYFSPGTFLFLIALLNLQGKGILLPRYDEQKNTRSFRRQPRVGRTIHNPS